MTITHQLSIARGVSVDVIETQTTLVAMRPLTELLGLDWKVQHRKLMADPERFSVVMMTTETSKGDREMVAVPHTQILHWLWSINVSKVNPEAVANLTALRTRLGAALDAFQNRQRDEARADVTRLTALLTTRAPAYSALIQAARAEATDEQMMRMSSRPRWKTAEMLRDLRTAGLIGPAHGGQQPLFPNPDAPTVMERLMGADDHV